MIMSFKLNDLEKMSPELATRILLLNTNEIIREQNGDLDDFTNNLFKLPVPKFGINTFVQNMNPKKSIYTEIDIVLPGMEERKKISITTKTRKVINGETNEPAFIYEIYYQCQNILYGKVLSMAYLEPGITSGHSLVTDSSGHIVLNLLYSFLPIEKVYINFLETLFIDELPKRYGVISSGDIMGFMFRGDNQCIKLLDNYGNRLLPIKEYLTHAENGGEDRS